MKDFQSITSTKRNADVASLVMSVLREGHEVSSVSSVNVWKMNEVPTTPQIESFASRSFADAGTDRHARIQEFMSKTEYWLDVEKYIQEKGLSSELEIVSRQGYEVLLYSKKYNARFRLDGLLSFNGDVYVFEIKTERQSANTYRNGPDAKHLKQGLFYALALHVKAILWLYEGRDFLEQKCFVQPVSQQDLDFINKYVLDIIKFKDEPYMLERSLKDCPSCIYKNYCRMYFNEYQKKLFLQKKGE